ncbi:MAG: helix-turn-helix transcriptional regulator [Candidatus Thorarchaeota archaeon]
MKFRPKVVRNSALYIIYLFISIFISRSPFLLESSISYSPLVDSQLFEIDLHNIKIDITSVQEINIVEKFTIRNTHNTTLNSIGLWVNQSLNNLVVQDLNGSLTIEKFQFTETTNLLRIFFRSELEENSTLDISILYGLANYPIPEQGNSYYFFEFESSITYFTKEQTLEIKIPEKSSIHEEEGITSFFPTDSIPIAGKRVYLSWSFTDISPYDNTFIFVRFDKPLGKQPIWPFIVGPFCGILIGAIATIIIMKRRQKKVVKKLATVFLSDTQKTLLKLILENDGKILQKELCVKTGFTKSRISRNITPLVEQKLVKRDKWGRNYVLTLTEEGKKVIE